LQWAEQVKLGLLTIALEHLTLARAGLLCLELETALHHPSDNHGVSA
jgi:hypothetical protein